MNAFQLLTHSICQQLRLRGYDLDGATDERIIRIACTYPPARKLLNKLGFEWAWPEDEKLRLCEVVRYNVAFHEHHVFVYNEHIFVNGNKCIHGNMIYCPTCWEKHHNA